MTDPSIESLLAEAYTRHEAGRTEAAARLYRKVLAKEPGQPDALHLYGTLLCAANRREDGVAHLRRAAAASPDDPAWLAQIGASLANQGAYAPAAALLERAVSLDPRSIRYRERLGMLLLNMTRCREAADVYRALVGIAPGDPAAWFNLGRAHEGLGAHADALAAFERALALKPDALFIRTSIAAAQLDLGRIEEALATCEDCLARAPGDMNGLAFKTVALLALGRREEAAYLLDGDRFIRRLEFDAPPGYASIAAFNEAIVAHIRGHPSLSFEHPAFSCRNGVTSDFLLAEPKGPLAPFERMLGAAFDDYRRALPADRTHPYVAATPRGACDIAIWATLLDRQGHQTAHIHPTGWLSGVYYVQVPDVIGAAGSGHAGWIEFGNPPEHFPRPAVELLRRFQPAPGVMLLFPSYFYHRTIPFDSERQRISIAFDFEPVAR